MTRLPQRNIKRLLILLLILAAAFLVYQYSPTPKTNAEPRAEAVEASAEQTAVQAAETTGASDTDVTAAAEPAPIQNISLDEPPPIIRGANNRMLFEEARPLERTTRPGQLFEQALFQTPVNAQLGELTINENTLAAIEVHVDPATVRAFIASGAERLQLPLPEGRDEVVKVDRIITRGVHTYTVIGQLESDPLSEATLVFHDGAVSGAIVDQKNNLHYKIGMSGDGDVVIRLLDTNTLQEGCGVGADELVTPGGTSTATTEGDAYDTPIGATVMDSVIGYGQGARIQEGGVAAIEATIVASIDILNQAIVNSEAGNNFVSLLATIEDPDYVFRGEIDFVMDSGDELGHLIAENDGILDTVSDLRIQLGADHNGFIIKQPDNSGGVARIDGNAMIVAVNYLNTYNNSFSHEFGHNLGCMHAFGDGTSTYATNRRDYGWRIVPASTSGRSTIMAYTNSGTWGNGGRINYFSNPTVQYDGVNTGAVDGYDASSDATVDPTLVNHPDAGSGYDGTHPNLGSNNAKDIIDHSATMAARATRTSLAVVDPVSAVSWTANQPHSIFWTGGDHTDTVSIDLYKGGVFDSTIASGLSGQNRWYTWTIPGSQAAGSDYTVRVTLNGSTYSESAAFTILEAPFTGVTWDGDTNSRWNIATNWSGDLVPSSSDDVVVSSSTSFRGAGAWILDSLGDGQFGTLSLSVADIGIRGNGNLSMYGDMTFTSSFTGTEGGSTTFFPNTTSAFGLIATSSQAIINNGTGASAVVSFAGPTAARTFDFSGNGGADTLSFGGSNNFSLGALVAVDETTLERVWTTDTFSGTLTLNGDANFMDPSIDVRIQSGTIDIAADEQIGDSTTIAFGTVAGASGTLDARGITETVGVLNNFSDATASLAILADISTSLTFANFNDGGVDRADIDVQGWVEGNSSLIFTSLINYDWTVAEGEAFVGLTIGGQPAYMTQVADVNGDTVADWAVTATSPSLLINAPYSLTGDNQIADGKAVIFDGGTLDLNGFTDTVGTLSLNSSGSIDLTAGGSIAFADSSAQTWAGTLNITGTLGTNSVRFGTDANGLSADQLRSIRIGSDYAWLDASGYLRPLIATPEAVSGDNSGSDYRIVGGSQLSGTGTIGSIDAAALAKVSPGTSGTPIATLNVAGDVDMALSTALRIDATRSGGAFVNDLVAASGSVNFSGTIDLYLDGEPLQAADEITVLTGSVPLRGYLDVPAQVVVDPASPTPLPTGLELKVVYYSDKITVLVQNLAPHPFGALNEGDFDHGMFFWDLDGPDNGADVNFALDASDPQAGRNSLKITVNTAGTAPEDLELYQSFHVLPVTGAESYTVSFKMKTDLATPTTVPWGIGGIEYVYPGFEYGRRVGTEPFPDVDGFSENAQLSSADGWKTLSRTFYPVDRDAAVIAISLGDLPAGNYWIDDVRVDGPVLPSATDFKVSGYYPAYRLGSIPMTNFEHIDVLNYSSIMSATDGSILPYYQTSTAAVRHDFFKDITDYEGNTISVIDHLQEIKNTWNLELIITVIGKKDADRADGFREMLNTQTTRETFADNLVQFCLDQGFDGVDLNFEWPSSSYDLNAVSEQQNYRYFVEYLRAALDAQGLSLSQAPGLFGPAYYDPDTYWRMDRNGHQGYAKDDATHIANIFKAYTVGMPLHTLHPGIIWAAEPTGGGDNTTYRTLYSNSSPAIARHETLVGGYTFNGIDSMRQKVQIARRMGCAGVMIWELGQDTVDNGASLRINALLDADDDALLDPWEQEHSGGLNLRPFDDDDGDGLWNLWENLTNTDPLSGGSQAAPIPGISGSQFQVSFPYIHSDRFDLFAEGSHNLTQWFPLDTGEGGNAEDILENGNLLIRQTEPIGSAEAYPFMRVGTMVSE